MTITKHKVVSLSYRLHNDAGDLIESKDAMTPLVYLHGEGMLLPVLEQALEGKQPGDAVNLTIPPQQAYGERDPELIEQVSGDVFGDQPAQPGMELHGNLEQTARVTKVEGDSITLDANPPLAGVTLQVDGEIVDVRDATPEEIALGHATGQEDGSPLLVVTMRSQKEAE